MHKFMISLGPIALLFSIACGSGGPAAGSSRAALSNDDGDADAGTDDAASADTATATFTETASATFDDNSSDPPPSRDQLAASALTTANGVCAAQNNGTQATLVTESFTSRATSIGAFLNYTGTYTCQ